MCLATRKLALERIAFKQGRFGVARKLISFSATEHCSNARFEIGKAAQYGVVSFMLNNTLELLLARRSVVANKLGEPGPDSGQLQQILTIAARVPDHKKLNPWRFIIFQGEARKDFGEVLAKAFEASDDDPSPARRETEANRFMRAPIVVAVICHLIEGSVVPEWEQILSTGAACQNLLIAANASGFSAQWITEWYAYDETVCSALGLEGSERVAGFIYIGTGQEQPSERDRPELKDIVTYWNSPIKN